MHIISLWSDPPPSISALLVHYNPETAVPIPLFDCTVPASFPSPAEDYLDKTLDLNDLVIQHPASNFLSKLRAIP